MSDGRALKTQFDVEAWLWECAYACRDVYGAEACATEKQVGWIAKLCVEIRVDPSAPDNPMNMDTNYDDNLEERRILSKEYASWMISELLRLKDEGMEKLAEGSAR